MQIIDIIKDKLRQLFSPRGNSIRTVNTFSWDNYKTSDLEKLCKFNDPDVLELLFKMFKEMHNSNCTALVTSNSYRQNKSKVACEIARVRGKYEAYVEIMEKVIKGAYKELAKRKAPKPTK
jgi:hypothetical protein